MTIKFSCNKQEFDNDYRDILRAFYPHISLDDNGEPLSLELCEIEENIFNCLIKYDNSEVLRSFTLDKAFLADKDSEYFEIKRNAQIKRHSKVALYDFLAKLTGQVLPYGSLTGIRPTKLYHETLEKGLDAKDYFLNTLKVSQGKVDLIKHICDNQKNYYHVKNNEVDVFVNIPICVSRCSYCSFISAELKRVKQFVTPYCDILIDELICTKKIIDKMGLKVSSVYIGGGTPTSLDDVNFERIIRESKFDCDEYTVEAGRPDTITKSKLDIMSKYGVTRISVNPQTFNQKTLDLIGRSHTIDEIYAVYKMAREYDFDINMDLIAMLPDENFDDFRNSVDCAIALDPDNITVHTLALKKGSALKVGGYDNSSFDLASSMVDYAQKTLEKNGYLPYYMYKQKYMSGNLENVGYCKKGKACIYNVHIMEEVSSIIANGAGGISKRIFDGDRLERLANPKGLDVYLQRRDKMLEDKEKFFS
ncbi:MAG: coproporphyrinogen dehydrogenase HemZ [Clostridia bacterium]|nr:coproporphyrinogen dehydrogenase HemZ [Clostridia bacterium]